MTRHDEGCCVADDRVEMREVEISSLLELSKDSNNGIIYLGLEER